MKQLSETPSKLQDATQHEFETTASPTLHAERSAIADAHEGTPL